MVAEKIETLVVFMEAKKKLKPPDAQAGPSDLRTARFLFAIEYVYVIM